MSVSRRGFLSLAALGAGAALAGCAGSSTSSPSTTAASASSAGSSAASTAAAGGVTVGLTYIPNIQFAPFYVAEKSGAFAKTGVPVTLRHHGSQEGLFTALAAGQEHLVAAGADEMMQAISQGMDLVCVAQYYRTYPVVAIVPEASTIKAASDLKGKNIGIPGHYGETYFGLLALLKAANLTESDVTVTEIGYTQQAALATKKVDAVMGYSNNDVVSFNAAGVPVRAIPLAASSVPLIGVSLIAQRAWADAHADAAKKVVDACTSGFQSALTNQAGAVDMSAAYISSLSDPTAKKQAASVLAESAKLWTSTGTVNPAMHEADFSAMSAFMASTGLTKSAVDGAKAMSNAYHS